MPRQEKVCRVTSRVPRLLEGKSRRYAIERSACRSSSGGDGASSERSGVSFGGEASTFGTFLNQEVEINTEKEKGTSTEHEQMPYGMIVGHVLQTVEDRTDGIA